MTLGQPHSCWRDVAPNHQKPSFIADAQALQHDKGYWRQQACSLPAGMVFLVSGEVKHFAHLIHLNLNSRLMPMWCDRLPSIRGSSARLFRFELNTISLFCCFTLLHQPVPNLVPNYPPAPLCNVSWGLSVCSVLVWSVSPCRLVLEVRCSLPPLRYFVHWPVVGVRFFLPLAFQGLPGFGRVCGVTSEQM